MRRYVKTIMLFLAIVTCLCCLIGCKTQKSEKEVAIERIERISKIELPADVEIVYHIRQKEGNHYQDAPYQYTVLQLKSEPIEWLQKNRFADSSNEVKRKAFENSFSSLISAKPNSMESIPSQYLPNYSELPYYYLLMNDAYYMFSPQNLWLIVIIS